MFHILLCQFLLLVRSLGFRTLWDFSIYTPIDIRYLVVVFSFIDRRKRYLMRFVFLCHFPRICYILNLDNKFEIDCRFCTLYCIFRFSVVRAKTLVCITDIASVITGIRFLNSLSSRLSSLFMFPHGPCLCSKYLADFLIFLLGVAKCIDCVFADRIYIFNEV